MSVGSVSFRDVRVVWAKELRETLRDRRTLTVMLLFPLVVYPLVSLLIAEVMAGKQATDEKRASRVAIVGSDRDARVALHAILTGKPRDNDGGDPDQDKSKDGSLDLVGESLRFPTSSGALRPSDASDVTAGKIDALVELGMPPAAAPPAVAPLAVRIVYDETRPASDRAHDRLTYALSQVLPPGCARSYAVSSASLATKTKVGGYVLSKILPLVVVIMTMLGAFYPAVDITAGERERGTLETLLSSPIRRFDLMTGKVLAVGTLALLTGALNIVSMSLTVAESARLAAGSAVLAIPWTRALATLLIVVPAAFLFASVMVAIGAMARSFKEAQTLLMPVYLLCLAPSLVASMADFPLVGITLVVPGTNLTLLARDLMLGTARVLPALVVLVSTLVSGALALGLAARLYDSERLLTSSDAELVSLRAWLAHLFGRGGAGAAQRPALAPVAPAAGHALALFGVAFTLWFFVFTWLERWRLLPGLLLSQWGGFVGLTWVYARLVRRPLADVLAFRRPRPQAVLGAVCLGFSCWIVLGIVADRVMPPPREVVEGIRRLIRPPGEPRPLWLSVFALAMTPAICEEALFRGPILRGFRRGLPAPIACLLTGILFGVMHGDVWRFIPTTLLGTLLAWVALTSGSIVPSMLLHVINNSTLIVLGYYGLDEAGEHLSLRADLLLLGGALILLIAGVAAVRAGRRPSAEIN